MYEVGGRVSRASPEWEELYRKRWEVERYFSLLKDNGWVENHRLRGLAKMDLHFPLGVLMFQAAALDRMAGPGIQAQFPGLHWVEESGTIDPAITRGPKRRTRQNPRISVEPIRVKAPTHRG